MQRDLNDIFEVPLEEVAGIVAMVRRRGIGFLWVLGLGFLLVATWMINALWGFVSSLLPGTLEVIDDLVTVITPLASLILLPLVFALIFQTMTAARIPWRAAWVGGAFTAVVFLLAAYGVGIYFCGRLSPMPNPPHPPEAWWSGARRNTGRRRTR